MPVSGKAGLSASWWELIDVLKPLPRDDWSILRLDFGTPVTLASIVRRPAVSAGQWELAVLESRCVTAVIGPERREPVEAGSAASERLRSFLFAAADVEHQDWSQTRLGWNSLWYEPADWTVSDTSQVVRAQRIPALPGGTTCGCELNEPGC